MSPEERSLLERTYKLAEENNKILVSIRRSTRIATAMRILYWVIILGLSFGAYYFIQPYIEFMSGMLLNIDDSNLGKTVNGLGDIRGTVSQIQDLLK